MTELPLVLAGPILRRVEGGQVSVWVALSEPRAVSLSLYTQIRTVGDLDDHLVVATAQTMQLGPRLHVALVTATVTGGLVADSTYSYNLSFGSGQDLVSLGLLADHPNDWTHRHLALGRVAGELPSFLTPPSNLADLRIVHGSCRKTLGKGPDALAWVAGLIQQDDTRPHQLFLTGDQIYADEIPANLLRELMVVSQTLMGGVERVPLRNAAGPTYEDCSFAPGFRQEMMVTQAGFTTTQGNSHLVSFGEFAAMYVMNWSNVVWPDPAGEEMADHLVTFSEIAKTVDDDVAWWDLYFPDSGSLMGDLLKGTTQSGLFEKVARDDPTVQETIKDWLEGHTADVTAALKRDISRVQFQYGEWFEKDADIRKAVQSFYETLPEVRRALANVPTYMLADDHEVTDDWNVTASWRDRVANTPLGPTILRNALASYIVFQAWGNVPDYWTGGSDDTLLKIANAVGDLDGEQNESNATTLNGHLGLTGPSYTSSVRFDFVVESAVHRVIALDTRTHRGFDTRLDPPALLDSGAVATQLATAGSDKLTFAISPAPTLSPAVVEEVVWPALMRIWDIRHAAGAIPVHGYEAFDAEAWAFNPPGFEEFVGRLAQCGRAVILSGDVHYAAGAVMDYFFPAKENRPPARIVQFTSSGFKNPFPDFAVAIIRGLSFTQQLLRFGAKIERLGWAAKPATPLILGNNQPVPPHLRARLKEQPTLLPTRGWPEGTTIGPDDPDWRWRFTLLADQRPEGERPQPAQVPATPVATATDHQGYFAAARRHMAALGQFTNSRKVSFAANLGLIRFENGGDTVVQDLYSVHPEHPEAPDRFAVHSAPLTPTGDAPPDIEYVEAH